MSAELQSELPQAAGPDRTERTLLLALSLAAFMVSLDARVVAPLLPTLAAEFHVSIAQVSWVVSSYLLPYGLFQLAYGPLADRLGKVRVAAYAMIAFSVGTALCGAFASFALVVALRALTGAAAAAVIPLTIAYIGDTVPYSQRQAALATLMASAGAAQAFSTGAGGTIAALLSWRTVFPVLGVFSLLVSLVLLAYHKREARPVPAPDVRPPTYRDALRAPRMRTLLALVSLEGFLFMGGFPFLSGLLDQRFGLGPLQIGLVLSLAGVSQLVSARVLPLLLRRMSEQELLVVGGAGMGGAYLICATARHWSWVAAGCLLVGAGFSLCHSTLQIRATDAFPRARGTALALFALSLFSGSALGSVCIGLLLERIGYGAAFGLASLLLVAFTAIAARTLGLRPTLLGGSAGSHR